MFKSKRSYGEFLQSNEKISTNILADRLQKLEAAGIAIKEIDNQNKSKFIYALTDNGKDLLPIMLEITAWSSKHDATTNTPDSFIEAFEKDKLALSSQILDNLK